MKTFKFFAAFKCLGALLLLGLSLSEAANTQNCLQRIESTLNRTRTNRGNLELGGFAYPITPQEVMEINREQGGSWMLTGDIASVLSGASRYRGFYEKCAYLLRGIAGFHAFDDGNKRTAQKVYERLLERNYVGSYLSQEQLRKVIQRIAKGELKEIDDIASELMSVPKGTSLPRPNNRYQGPAPQKDSYPRSLN